MKTKIFILILLLLLGGAYYVFKTKPVHVVPADEKPIQTVGVADGMYCFSYSHTATQTEPYEVHEHAVLDIDGSSVKGTKKGTQAGPDMTNGYEGTLTGTIAGDTIEVTYSYMVEGSRNKELEIYTFSPETLIKLRWPLIEKKDILVPDKTGEPKMISYSKETCK